MTEEINYWSDLEGKCPMNIERIIKYYKSFQSYLPTRITLNNLNQSKESLFNARSSLDSMITSLIQMLYDKELLQEETDKVLFAWLVDNLGRFMKRLDEQEEHLIVKFDEPTSESRVGISRLSSYMKILRTASDSLIFESLLKATKEYIEIEETENIKKEPRTFLYILFQVLQITLSILGGLAREKTSVGKKGMIHNIPLSWQSLMSKPGQEVIKEGYKEDTGIDVSKFEDLELLNTEEDLDEESDIESS